MKERLRPDPTTVVLTKRKKTETERKSTDKGLAWEVSGDWARNRQREVGWVSNDRCLHCGKESGESYRLYECETYKKLGWTCPATSACISSKQQPAREEWFGKGASMKRNGVNCGSKGEELVPPPPPPLGPPPDEDTSDDEWSWQWSFVENFGQFFAFHRTWLFCVSPHFVACSLHVGVGSMLLRCWWCHLQRDKEPACIIHAKEEHWQVTDLWVVFFHLWCERSWRAVQSTREMMQG